MLPDLVGDRVQSTIAAIVVNSINTSTTVTTDRLWGNRLTPAPSARLISFINRASCATVSHAVAVNMLKRIENTAAVIRRKPEEGNNAMDFSLTVGREKGGGEFAARGASDK